MIEIWIKFRFYLKGCDALDNYNPYKLTALNRKNLSVPVRTLINKGYIHKGQTILDFGCGNGFDVKELQKKLRVSADGIFGNNTKNAVKKFQKSNRLTADGIVGKNTAHKLGWLYKGK